MGIAKKQYAKAIAFVLVICTVAAFIFSIGNVPSYAATNYGSKEYVTKTPSSNEGITLSKVANGKWYAYKNGKIDRTYSGVTKNKYGWWYCKEGVLQFEYTGVAPNQYGWWRIEQGKLNFDYTGLARNYYGWVYCKNGKVDWSHTGLVKNDYGWWYVQKGKITFKYNGVAKNSKGTWFCKKSKIDFNFSGKYTAPNGYVYVIKNGKVVSSKAPATTTKPATTAKPATTTGKPTTQTTTAKPSETTTVVPNEPIATTKPSTTATTTKPTTTAASTTTTTTTKPATTSTTTALAPLTASVKTSNTRYTCPAKVTIKGVATGGSGGYKYKIIIYSYTSKSTYVLQDYSTVDSAVWDAWVSGPKKVSVDITDSKGNYARGSIDINIDGMGTDADGKWVLYDNGKISTKTGLVEGMVNGEQGTWYVKGGYYQDSYTGIVASESKKYYLRNGKVQDDFTGTVFVGDTLYSVKSGVVTGTVSAPAKENGSFIDISAWQGDMNFTKMKSTGIKGVMLRGAYSNTKDKYFDTYTSQAKAADIPCGVYQFATWHYGTDQATAMTKAKQQAQNLISYMNGKNIQGYVVLDLELESGYSVAMTPQELTAVANYYMGLIKAAGYKPMLYCSISWLYDRMVPQSINYPLWIAYYYNTGSHAFPTTSYGQKMTAIKDQIYFWQYSSKGTAATYGGGSGYIDLDYSYRSFTGAGV